MQLIDSKIIIMKYSIDITFYKFDLIFEHRKFSYESIELMDKF